VPEIKIEGKELKERIPRKIKCKKCQGTKFYSGRYGQHSCEECFDGYVFLKEYNRLQKAKEEK
jgi:DnaJ-class molecular chaperone